VIVTGLVVGIVSVIEIVAHWNVTNVVNVVILHETAGINVVLVDLAVVLTDIETVAEADAIVVETEGTGF
jgi:hypothetical protein